MTEQRTNYATVLLTEKSPFESTETIRVRLSQAKMMNKNCYDLIKDISDLKKSYVNQLNKIISDKEDLDKLLKRQMVTSGVMNSEELQLFDFDSAGHMRDLWSIAIQGLKGEAKATSHFYKALDTDVLIMLRAVTEKDPKWDEIRALHLKLSECVQEMKATHGSNKASPNEIFEAERMWESQAPILFELFEDIDLSRLETAKTAMMTYQTSISDYIITSKRHCEREMSKFLEFNPEEEITRFAHDATKFDFKMFHRINKIRGKEKQKRREMQIRLQKQQLQIEKQSEVHKQQQLQFQQQQQQQQQVLRRNYSSPNTKKKGMLGIFSNSKSPSSPNLMNDEFSDSSNNKYLGGGFKSKMGSILGLSKSSKMSKNLSNGNNNIIQNPEDDDDDDGEDEFYEVRRNSMFDTPRTPRRSRSDGDKNNRNSIVSRHSISVDMISSPVTSDRNSFRSHGYSPNTPQTPEFSKDQNQSSRLSSQKNRKSITSPDINQLPPEPILEEKEPTPLNGGYYPIKNNDKRKIQQSHLGSTEPVEYSPISDYQDTNDTLDRENLKLNYQNTPQTNYQTSPEIEYSTPIGTSHDQNPYHYDYNKKPEIKNDFEPEQPSQAPPPPPPQQVSYEYNDTNIAPEVSNTGSSQDPFRDPSIQQNYPTTQQQQQQQYNNDDPQVNENINNYNNNNDNYYANTSNNQYDNTQSNQYDNAQYNQYQYNNTQTNQYDNTQSNQNNIYNQPPQMPASRPNVKNYSSASNMQSTMDYNEQLQNTSYNQDMTNNTKDQNYSQNYDNNYLDGNQASIYEQGAPEPIQRSMTGQLKKLDPQLSGPSSRPEGQNIFQHNDFNSSTTGLNASIAEVINASYEGGTLIASEIVGEIALKYTPQSIDNSTLPEAINLQVGNAGKFNSLVLNQAFVQQLTEDQFRILPQFIDQRTLGAVKYTLVNGPSPLVINPVWKFEESQASMVLSIKISPSAPPYVQELILEDFAVFATIEGANTTGALSKPQGSFSKEKKRIAWRFKEPITLPRNGEQRLIARFLTDGMAHETKNGTSIEFTIHNQYIGSDVYLQAQELLSSNPFGDAWNLVHFTKTATAGSYHGLG